MFTLDHQSKKSRARVGRVTTAHGVIHTPFFMPIATRGAVRHVFPRELKTAGAEIVLSNTYHLYLQPGEEVLAQFGGLHRFMGWDGPILTDSGGYQVFSLGERSRDARKLLEYIGDDEVIFRSLKDGSRHTFTPERVIDIQHAIGSDIMMVLDECVGNPATKERAKHAMERTHDWAARSVERMKEWRRSPSPRRRGSGERSAGEGGGEVWRGKGRVLNTDVKRHHLFGIVQGALDETLRKKSVQTLAAMDFDGYALGGLAVGEPRKELYRVVDLIAPRMPANKPRYLMGVGEPEDIIRAVKAGIDMFDCVIPTRNGRHGRLYVWQRDWRAALHAGRLVYDKVQITNARFRRDASPVDPLSPYHEATACSRAYLHHLFKTNEALGQHIASLTNLSFFLSLMARLRGHIIGGKF